MNTGAGKSAEAAIKIFATQKLQVEKDKMLGWKKNVMQEVGRELQVIQLRQEEAMEAQRQSFQMVLERVREKLELWESKSRLLENEIKLLKAPKQHQVQRKPAAGNAQTVDDDGQVGEPKNTQVAEQENNQRNKPVDKQTNGPAIRRESTNEETIIPSQSQTCKIHTSTPNASLKKHVPEKQSYASVASSKPAQVPEHPWTEVKYKNRKPNHLQQATKLLADVENQGRRILFPRKSPSVQMSEADLMLALNEALQKAGEGSDIRFSRVKYAPSGAIYALITEKANAGLLIPRLSNSLIRAAKTVDAAVVGVEILEHWQRLKVHGMPLERYLGDGKMELLQREVESSTGI